jgi:PPM family protein phosphatase
VYLLATDGLTRELEDGEIASILTGFFSRVDAATSLQQAALELACEALVSAANAQGGGDNITVLLIGCV